MYKSVTFVLLSAIFASGCSLAEEIEIPEHLREVENLTVYPADVKPVYSINFEREAGFGDTEEVIFGRVGSLAVDGSGRVFIADGSERTIHVFHPDGNFLTSIGREGSGPGEFQNISGMKIQSGQLFVHDSRLQRIVVYSLSDLFADSGSAATSAYSYTVELTPENWRHIEDSAGFSSTPSRFFFLGDESILTGFSKMYTPEERYLRYYLLDHEGRIISDRILEQRDSDMYTTMIDGGSYVLRLPFGRKPLIAASDEGRIYAAYSDEFLVKKYNPDSGYERAIYYPYDSGVVNRRDVMSRIGEDNARILRDAEFPERWPVLEEMLIDDENQLWIATITDDDEQYEWKVLDQYGELLAQFQWPGNRLRPFYQSEEVEKIQTIRDGYLYTRGTDEMGVASIVRYRIEMEEK